MSLDYRAYLAAVEIEKLMIDTWGTRPKRSKIDLKSKKLKEDLLLFYRESKKPHVKKCSVYYEAGMHLAKLLKRPNMERHFRKLYELTLENERDDRIGETMMDTMWGL